MIAFANWRTSRDYPNRPTWRSTSDHLSGAALYAGFLGHDVDAAYLRELAEAADEIADELPLPPVVQTIAKAPPAPTIHDVMVTNVVQLADIRVGHQARLHNMDAWLTVTDIFVGQETGMTYITLEDGIVATYDQIAEVCAP